MMLKKVFFAVLSCLLLAMPVHAKTVGSVEMENSMKLNDSALILNGAGIRTKFMQDIYVAGLYLKDKNNDFKLIINQDEPMAIKIKIVSRLITSERFKEACEEGFVRTTNGNPAPLRNKIDQAYTAFAQKFNVGDVFDIVYEKGTGTRFSKNGKLITTVDGLEFKKALFGIWIIDKPSHKCEGLRKGMLGLQ